jgi:hypothetical protein
MEPSLAAHLVLEMLDRVCHESSLAIDTGIGKCAIHYPTRRPDGRTPGAILLISGLFAHDHETRLSGLRPAPPASRFYRVNGADNALRRQRVP